MGNLWRGIQSLFQRGVKAPPPSFEDIPDATERVVAFELNAGWDSIKPIRANAYKTTDVEAELLDGGLWNLRITADVAGLANAYIASVWAFRCIEARSWAVGRMKWRIIHKRSKQVVEMHPLGRALQRRRDLIRRIEWSLCIWGEAFLEKQLNALAYPAGLGWLNPMGMDVDTSGGRIRAFRYSAVNGGQYTTFKPEEVVFIRTPNPYDDLRGMPPLLTALNEVRVDRDISRMMQAFYANDARPGILLVPKEPLSEMDMQRFLDFWKATYGSPRNAGKPALVPYELDVREVQRAPTQDDTALRESMRREICAAFGVPLSYAGAWDSSTYQSSPEQRRAFYEDTVIPQCEMIADALNEQAMPFFDSSGDYVFEFDYSDILALSELRASQEQMYRERWQQGLMTFNEVRMALGMSRLPGGDVVLVGGNMIPISQIGQVARSTTETIIESGSMEAPIAVESSRTLPVDKHTPQEPQEPQKPEAPDTPQTPRKPAEPRKPIKPQVEAPLDAKALIDVWENLALSDPHADIESDIIPAEIAFRVRSALLAAAKVSDRHVAERLIRTAMAEARQKLDHLKSAPAAETLDIPAVESDSVTPEEAQAYWENYDKIQAEIGTAWIDDYQSEIWRRVRELIQRDGTLDESALVSIMSDLEDKLIETWVGDADEPGAFTKLILAGAAAADQALEGGNPAPDAAKAERTLVSWRVRFPEAIRWARLQAGRAIQNINNTTRDRVRRVLAEWAESGAPLSELIMRLRQIFLDPVRAERIAQTESTAAYQAGAQERYTQAGVTYLRFQTVRDERVCAVCAPLHNTIAPISTGWTGIEGNPKPPIHVGCRCFTRPVTTAELESNKWKKWRG